MICPYCDSRVREVPDNRCCPNCGGPLGQQPKPKFPKPPLGVYRGVRGHLEIRENEVVFSKNFLGMGKTIAVIQYEDIKEIYCKAPTWLLAGFLCVRDWENRKKPYSTTWQEQVQDACAIGFYNEYAEEFMQVYEFLKECARIANEARAESE